MLDFIRRWTVDQWRIAHEEALPAGQRPPFSLAPLGVLLTVAIVLTLHEYWGDRDTFARIWTRPPNREWMQNHYELTSFVWWTGWRVGGFLLLPALLVVASGQRLRDYGFSLAGFRRHIGIYLGLYAAILPVVIIASKTTAFRETYPFYKLANRSSFDLWAWEAMYALQFLSLEFFFRGFMLHGLKRVMGAHCIWVMVVPYTMIHFGKPMAETIGAAFAGVILGTLALRTRSIWSGVLIHVSVALTMDLLSLAACPENRPCPSHRDYPWEQMEYGR